ncbi:capsular biosynthesis protein, partial [Campylobacter coli]|nr:capsular biosynthesis protein [Campylobacter coli]
FKFKKDSVFVNKNLDDFIQPNCASVVFNKEKIKNIIFREELKPVLEDVRFVAEFLVQNINSKSIFLKNAKYFYRKRAQQNSIMDTFWKDKGYFLISPKIGTLYLLQNYKIYSFVQKVCIYHMFWQIKALIFNPEKLAILNNEEKELFKELLFENFKFIDSCNIKNFNLHAF